MAMGLLDLSIITDHLIQMLRDCIADSDIWNLEPTPAEGTPVGANPSQPVNINVTGNAPDVIRANSSGCLLSLYLFHVAQDPYQRNSPVVGDRMRVPVNLFQPMSLNLYYLLSAYSDGRYIEEQQAMSIALKCFHEQSIVRNVVLAGDGRPRGEFTLTMEAETSDTLGRLWQATTSALRLATVYKVSVVFLQPREERRATPPRPERVGLSVAPTTLPFAQPGQLIAASRHVRLIGPDDVPLDPNQRDFHEYDLLPAVVAPGEDFLLYGVGLAPPPAQPLKLFLVRPPAADLDITATWIDPVVARNTDTRLHLNLPDPAPVPAGIYQLRAEMGAFRTNATPLSIAARVDAPPSPPVLTYAGTPLSLTGAGFLTGQTEVLLGTVPLTEGAIGPGNFAITGGGSGIDFQPPADIPIGRHAVRVRVNQVESSPAVWVKI